MSGMPGTSVLAILVAASAFGADGAPEACQTAVLRNGFTMEYARSEAAGPVTRLWLCAGAGFVEIPGERIERLEQSRSAPPAAPVHEPAASGPPAVEDPIGKLIASAASRSRIDPDFVASVVRAESAFNPAAVSSKGALGLMQLMPQTAAWLGVDNLLDPAANLEGGTRYLRQLLDRYGGDAATALAAYNAGPQRVAQYGGVPPYRETRAYITRVIDDYNRQKLRQQAQGGPAPVDK